MISGDFHIEELVTHAIRVALSSSKYDDSKLTRKLELADICLLAFNDEHWNQYRKLSQYHVMGLNLNIVLDDLLEIATQHTILKRNTDGQYQINGALGETTTYLNSLH